jgi:hypothetical protein
MDANIHRAVLCCRDLFVSSGRGLSRDTPCGVGEGWFSCVDILREVIILQRNNAEPVRAAAAFDTNHGITLGIS